MLKESELAYLNRLSPERANAPVVVRPYDPKTAQLAEKTIRTIRQKIPKVDVRFMGATAMKISGQNDIDIYVITPQEMRGEYIEKLKEVFGDWPERKWHWYESGIEISVYLSDPDDYKLKEHLDLFKILTTNPSILKEYEDLKIAMSGRSYRDYQIAKYEFYNRILGFE